MADTKDDGKMEDEYQVSGEEFTPEYEEAGPDLEVEPEPSLDFGQTADEPEMAMEGPSPVVKKLLMITGIVVGTVIIGAYLIYSETSSRLADVQQGIPEQEQNIAANVAQAPKAVPPRPAPVTAAAPEPEPAPMPSQLPAILQSQMAPESTEVPTAAVPTQVTTEQGEQLTQLARQVRSNKLTLDNLEVRIQTLQESVKKGMSDMQATLEKKMADQPKKKVKLKQSYRKPVARKPAKERERYGLKAVVPGRAWIWGSQGGQAMTVSMGDRIPGYGKVLKIDAAVGRVVTSSGVVIVYAPGDY